MNCREVLQELESLGSEQTRKIYRRHGVTSELFGVSYKSFGLLKKRLKVDHRLAKELWASGIHDARVLATMIADPAQIDARLADAWVRDLNEPPLTDAFANLVADTRLAERKAKAWIKSRQEWVGRAGWLLVALLAKNDESLDNEFFAARIREIEAGIQRAKNRVRDAMNSALISIGLRNASLRRLALAAARRIGKVEVDLGQTSCKTPDAAQYIAKSLAHRHKKACGAMP